MSAITREQVGRYCVFQSEGEYKFSADSLLLARFARVRPGERAADLCAGCGVVGMRALSDEPSATCDFFELNPRLCDLIRAAIDENGLSGRCAVFPGRVQDAQRERYGAYTLLLANPPYFPARESTEDFYRAAARTECALALSELTDTAARLLAPGGVFALCHRADRAAEVIAALEGRKLAVKRLQFAASGRDKPPYLVLIEAKKGARPGVRVLPALITEGEI